MKPFVYSGYYVGEGVSSPIINEYESRQNPNMIHVNNTWDYATYFRYFLQRAESLIIFDGMPSNWSKNYIYPLLFLKGNFCVMNTARFGIIPQHGNPYGFDVQYQPTNYVVANPAFDASFNGDLIIGEDCEIVKLTPDWCGIGDLINSYAQRVAMALSNHDVASALAKFGFIFTAKNKSTAETFKVAFDDIMSGKLAVIINQALYDKETGKALYEFFNNDIEKCYNVVKSALESVENLKHAFDMEIGIYTAPEKKERMITDEVEETKNAVMSKCELWVETLNECLEKVNAHYNIDISARLRYPTNRGGDQRENYNSNSDSI
jgi:hypothetical protein